MATIKSWTLHNTVTHTVANTNTHTHNHLRLIMLSKIRKRKADDNLPQILHWTVLDTQLQDITRPQLNYTVYMI